MNDRLEKLGQLKSLLDSGALSEDEFAREKARVLNTSAHSKSLLIGGFIISVVAAGGSIWLLKSKSGAQPEVIAEGSQSASDATSTGLIAAPPSPKPSDPYEGAVLTGCRQDTCMWQKTLGTRIVRKTSNGVLEVEETFQGTSLHKKAPYPIKYSINIPIQWEHGKIQTYVFCSKDQPSIAFKDRWSGGTGRWLAHLLDLYDTYGYNTDSAVTYMKVCHNINFSRRDINRVLSKLGYFPGTRNEQVELGSPLDLPTPPPPEPS